MASDTKLPFVSVKLTASAGEPFLARLQELLRPTVVQVLIDPFLAAQISNAVLAAQAFLAAVVRKKLGLRLTQKTDGERVYRIVAGKASADATGVPSA